MVISPYILVLRVVLHLYLMFLPLMYNHMILMVIGLVSLFLGSEVVFLVLQLVQLSESFGVQILYTIWIN